MLNIIGGFNRKLGVDCNIKRSFFEIFLTLLTAVDILFSVTYYLSWKIIILKKLYIDKILNKHTSESWYDENEFKILIDVTLYSTTSHKTDKNENWNQLKYGWYF